MKLKFLAIGDTHLGEDTSLLGFPHGLQRLWDALRGAFGERRPDGGTEPVEVEELILLGDIPDRTLSSTAQLTTATNAFMSMVASALRVRRVIYVPGNHDHTIFGQLADDLELESITGPEGVPIVRSQGRAGSPSVDLRAQELLAIFFGYPHGAPWNRLIEQWPIDFSVANPVYARRHAGRTYAFVHGTHFRSDVLLPGWVKLLVDQLQVDKLLGGMELDTGGLDPRGARDLLDLERRITPFVESLWPSSRDRPTSRSDELWYLLMTLSSRVGKHMPPPAEDFVLYSRERLLAERPQRVRELVPPTRPGSAKAVPHPSVPRLTACFLPHLLSYLREHGLDGPELTLVYGDTHDGGFGELEHPTGGGHRVRLYNTGGWVVHNQDDHPPTQLFAVDEAGNELILDVGFRGVRLSPSDPETELLDMAAEDAEHRASTAGRLLRALLSALPRNG
jgi:hypothetical protein